MIQSSFLTEIASMLAEHRTARLPSAMAIISVPALRLLARGTHCRRDHFAALPDLRLTGGALEYAEACCFAA